MDYVSGDKALSVNKAPTLDSSPALGQAQRESKAVAVELAPTEDTLVAVHRALVGEKDIALNKALPVYQTLVVDRVRCE
ncbi:hypothetical protein NDU88_007726 [Pleurodeles waltl]|uniref:Uncharacterized protein n=1 Tax=Pleurodeles waltl TaxID=8319 RepID=A0AAV7N6Q0_PLEWA|nr:hypothetical protein NDU88_007726 [Pleurodeles waltl]